MLVRFAGDMRTFITFKHITRGKDKRTVCRVWSKHSNEGSEPVLLSMGEARCSQEDAYKKETGRRLAMTRALETFDKEFRSAAWEAYWSRGVINRDDEVNFIAAYVPDQEGMTYQEARTLATIMDNNAASVFSQSIPDVANG